MDDCSICEGNASKYKCTNCRIPYCSVACSKKHKETPCEAPLSDKTPDEPKIGPDTYDYPTEDTVPIEKFKLLENSQELRRCLDNPHLRQILEELDAHERPHGLIKHFMQEPLFTEFVDECLKIIEPKQEVDIA